MRSSLNKAGGRQWFPDDGIGALHANSARLRNSRSPSAIGTKSESVRKVALAWQAVRESGSLCLNNTSQPVELNGWRGKCNRMDNGCECTMASVVSISVSLPSIVAHNHA